LAKKPKNDHGRGFRRSPKQWENSIADHVGKFVDKITVTDALNIVAFAGGAYATYYGINKAAEISKGIPDWFKILSPLSPLAYQLVIPTEVAKAMSETDKIVLALLGGYSTVKLIPYVVPAAESAIKSLTGLG